MKLTAKMGTITKIAAIDLTSWVLCGWTLMCMYGYDAIIKKVR